MISLPDAPLNTMVSEAAAAVRRRQSRRPDPTRRCRRPGRGRPCRRRRCRRRRRRRDRRTNTSLPLPPMSVSSPFWPTTTVRSVSVNTPFFWSIRIGVIAVAGFDQDRVEGAPEEGEVDGPVVVEVDAFRTSALRGSSRRVIGLPSGCRERDASANLGRGLPGRRGHGPDVRRGRRRGRARRCCGAGRRRPTWKTDRGSMVRGANIGAAPFLACLGSRENWPAGLWDRRPGERRYAASAA